jgi:Tol biopolymer transport system component
MGTASYMSPEQAKAAHVDTRSDVFSFGAVLCELLTGEQAFRRDSNVETMYAILHDEPAGLEVLGRWAPAGLVRVLRRCLEKEPGRRFQNGKELAEALTQVEALSESSWGASARPRDARSRWRRRSWVALTGAVLLVGGAWLGFSRPPPDAGSEPAAGPPLAAVRTVPLTGLSGKAWDPSFSPSGDRVAFVWTGDAKDRNDDIYVKPLDGATPRRLTTSPDREISPVWSRDGRDIAFVRFSGEERSIFMITAVGGSERKLLTADVPSFHGWGGRIDWSPDGDSIAYSDAAAPNRPTGLYRLSVGTLERQQLTSPPESSIGDQQPAYSPDGTMLAFVRLLSYYVADAYVMPAGVSWRVNEFHRLLYFAADVYVMPAGGGEPTRLTFDNTVVQGLAWAPDGRSIVFSSDRGGTSGLWRVPAAGGEPEPFGVGDGAITPAISRQGQRLAYAKPFVIMSTSRLDLPVSPSSAGSRTKVLSTTAGDAAPRISPDGRRIAVASSRSGWREIWVCDGDGSNLLQLTALGRSSTGSPQWSPDGRSIAFDTRLDEQSDVYVIGADGGPPRRLTDDPADDHVPSWSRDGRWVYFASNRTGQDQIWKMPAGGGDAVQVTRQGGLAAFESVDGKYLYYAKDDPPGVWRVPVAGGEEESVVPGVNRWRWAPGEKGIYFSEPEGDGGVIKFLSFATRRTTRVAAMERPPALGLAVSPDERWLLYAQVDVETTNIFLVENLR